MSVEAETALSRRAAMVLISMTRQIVCAYVERAQLKPDELPALIRSVHGAFVELAQAPSAPRELKPAVHPSKSVHEDFIVCLEDGRRLKMLKRHLRATYGLTPNEYRKSGA